MPVIQFDRMLNEPRPWQALATAAGRLELDPSDSHAREAGVLASIKLGLKSIARELLAGASSKQATAMREQIERLPDDRAIPDRLIGTCRRNLAVLSARGLGSWTTFGTWSEMLAAREPIIAVDGNVLFRDGKAGGIGRWGPIADLAGAARQFMRNHPLRAEVFPKPMLIEGLETPWLLIEAYRATPRTPDGYSSRLYVGEAEERAALDGLAVADLSRELSDDRVEVFIGPGAEERFRGVLESRRDLAPVGHFASFAGAGGEFKRVVEEALRGQGARLESLRARVASIFGGRDRAWWAKRYASARNGGRPLRVLLPTSIYSTFVQHSARDLAEAFEGMGWEARVLIEPTEHDRLTSLSYLEALASFEPDLIVSINYPRSHLAGAIPTAVPVVCWIQDAMPHLFDEGTGRLLGEMDIVAGHLFPELFEQFGYPRERTLAMPVVASARKFTPTPVPPSHRARFECEIALASHHSETPESMHRRLCREAGDGRTAVMFEALYPEVRAAVRACATQPLQPRLRQVVQRIVREHAAEANDRAVALVLHQYAQPMADRLIRHETLAWAAELAERRGWRLRIFGRGWETHPTLAGFACGELMHGDELRASYQCAAVHLHVSAGWLMHQRVMECALSGGLPACRVKMDDLKGVRARAAHRALSSACPSRIGDGGLTHVDLADSPHLMLAARHLQILGVGMESVVRVNRETTLRTSQPSATDPEWLLVDIAETGFATIEHFERLVERFVEDADRRRGMSEAIARRVRSRLTTDVLASNIERSIRDVIDGQWNAAHAA